MLSRRFLPNARGIFLHHENIAVLQMQDEFVEAGSFKDELATAKIEAKKFVAGVFHGDEVGVGNLPAHP
ncbi:hypothetical protein ABENE_20515 [Asticcacaulis benevestitus DSM 16100 = ATCC BAA-896]|uniref:Uncharacterized protein n=1 Tax=Asticcacaulis benevestitus DSM 16100 = ATCC BAA-896 TaxID=1121022 RepID=V4P7A4_9CAUL|nr:hypothetical protein ABENE_20515 [Asticcacaulis benevestitus DSM 16100 = ATCC BAA-896]